MVRAAFLAAAAFAVTACASPGAQEAADRDCFHADMVSGYSYLDENHISVSVGANRRYVLTTMFNARDLDWTHAIALRSTTHLICTGNGLGVEIIGGEPHRRYPISAIERAPDEGPVVEGS